MAKTLTLKKGSVVTLARLFECTEQTIRNAARGVTSGEEAERIRVEVHSFSSTPSVITRFLGFRFTKLQDAHSFSPYLRQ